MRAYRPEHPSITFRSMLEGQWSTVFDHLGLRWEYEPVEFDLPSGRYTPDFRITAPDGLTFWVEVKGPWPNAREFEVATEVNLYYLPLLILTGDVPRQANGGTSWYFDLHDRQWHMLRPEEALIRIIADPENQPDALPGWAEAIDAGRHTELIKVGSST